MEIEKTEKEIVEERALAIRTWIKDDIYDTFSEDRGIIALRSEESKKAFEIVNSLGEIGLIHMMTLHRRSMEIYRNVITLISELKLEKCPDKNFADSFVKNYIEIEVDRIMRRGPGYEIPQISFINK